MRTCIAAFHVRGISNGRKQWKHPSAAFTAYINYITIFIVNRQFLKKYSMAQFFQSCRFRPCLNKNWICKPYVAVYCIWLACFCSSEFTLDKSLSKSVFWRTTPKRTALRISGTSPMTECGERLSSVRGWTLCWKKSGREMWLRSLSKTKAGLVVMLSKWGF